MSKKNTIFVIIAVVLVCLMAALYFVFRPAADPGMKKITVEVTHLDGEHASFTYETEADFLGECLQEEVGLVDGEDAEYGLMITTVDKETADASKEQWWGYTVNGEFSNYGADTQPIKDGDVYEFTINEGYDSF